MYASSIFYYCLLAIFLESADAVFYRKHDFPVKKYAHVDHVQTGYFRQILNHSNPSQGTFLQRYYYTDKYYNGPGSPIVLSTAGESSIEGTQYFLNAGDCIVGEFAKSIGGGAVVLEHRYWGKSSPYRNLTTKNLQLHTLQNSIADFVHFARTVKLPFDKHGTSQATKAPWVLSGGSYPGALAAWIESTAPGTFWAYHASSAVVQTIYNFWEYSYVTRRFAMPKSCAADTALVIEYVDKTLKHGDSKQQADLKAMFGLADLKHDTDFAAVLVLPTEWQSGPKTSFCQRVAKGDPKKYRSGTPGSKLKLPAKNHARLRRALSGYAAFIESYTRGFCSYSEPKGSGPHACFKTYNKNSFLYTETGVNNPFDRQWIWMLCNEPFAWWMGAEPASHKSLVSSFLTPEYSQRECELYFPTEEGFTFGSNRGRTTQDVNKYTQGWNRQKSKRLMWANFENDPWREATVSATLRPGGPQQSTPDEPVYFLPGGYHCGDYYIPYGNSKFDNETRKFIAKEVAQMKKWVHEHPAFAKRSSE